MHGVVLAALIPLALGQQHLMLNLDCNDYPGPCNNDCYAVYVANQKQVLSYRGPGDNVDNRKAGGCNANPCNKGKMAKPNPDENSCDEYPYAARENSREGSRFSGFLASNCGVGNRPCSFMVTFGNVYAGLTPYCQDVGGANDGFEYTFVGKGKFQLAGRDTNTTTDEDDWVLHKPDPAHFFPPHLRREYLLEDGSRTVLPTRDTNVSYDGTIFHTLRNGTVYPIRAVRELFGMEKSPALRDPSLQG